MNSLQIIYYVEEIKICKITCYILQKVHFVIELVDVQTALTPSFIYKDTDLN